jgi:hypothetical protein
MPGIYLPAFLPAGVQSWADTYFCRWAYVQFRRDQTGGNHITASLQNREDLWVSADSRFCIDPRHVSVDHPQEGKKQM